MLVDKIIAYEQGELSDTETVELFAQLVKSGMAWTLQGHYGRTAKALIDNGYIDEAGDVCYNKLSTADNNVY
ncbi:hypothetical protein LCGC14_0360450 [marine sediment metagenome]|uniref:DUF7417 domain-containing protein n=1 Tax=marine sediment metagenome TaxID=412755 RepID=A0A0F9VVL4_9ZZZZ|nr:hypothetical protein [bacterium]